MTSGARRVAWVTFAAVMLGVVVSLSLCRPGRRRTPPPPIGGTALELGRFALVEGSDLFRAELYDDFGGYSYSSSGRTRNIAFIRESGEARWLLPDDDHVVVEHRIPGEEMYARGGPIPPVAIAALVKPVEGDQTKNVLLLYDPTARKIQSVAEGVLNVHGVSLAADRGVTILYERQGQYVIATFDAVSLSRRREAPVTFPAVR